MPFLEDKLEKLVGGSKSYDIDSSDRIKYVYTVWALIITALFIFGKQYIGEAVQCWTPEQFADGWEEYAEDYCLIEGTYFVPMNQSELPKAHLRENMEMRYYQWVPFILTMQAFFLYIPRILWKLLQKINGADFGNVSLSLRKHAKTLGAALPKPKFTSVPHEHNLTRCLLIVKTVSIFLLILQSFLFDLFLSSSPFFGFNVVVDLLRGRQWPESGHFPRVAFCDFEVREVGAVQRWTLQCVLTVNMFNEKIFIFAWWWFVVLLLISILNLFKWILRQRNSSQYSFIKRLLEYGGIEPSKSGVESFNSIILHSDGINFVRLIHENATVFEASEWVTSMWNNAKRQ